MVSQSSTWQLRPIVVSLLLAAVLVVTYLNGLWQGIDEWVAFKLNHLIADNPRQQHFWAWANLHSYDKFMGVIMVAWALIYVFFGSRDVWVVRAAKFFIISISILVFSSLSHSLIYDDVINASPSLVLEPFIQLSDVSDLGAKSSSSTSFPSDHGTIVWLYTYFLWAWAGRRFGWGALLLSIAACLPRLVVGAHWLTDSLVGSLSTALVVVPWFVFTPLGHAIALPLARFFALVLQRLKFPVQAARVD